MNKKIKVSICCVTYNQEEYIEKALKTFINQKTKFNYEIIVHDDASTDNTIKIINKYSKKYPDLIIPIIEKENQYTKKPNSILEICFSKARGEYIALCDGDDGFLDENKLEKQIMYMDSNPKITLCSHNTQVIDSNGEFVDKIDPYNSEIITAEKFLENLQSMHTSSMIFRKKDVMQLPDYFHLATVGDLPLKLHLLSLGNAYHINKVMSFYRRNANGSWSLFQKKDALLLEKNHKMEVDVYKLFNKQTNFKYDKLVKSRISTIQFNYYLKTNNLKQLKKKEYSSLYSKLSFKQKLKLKVKNIKTIYKIYLKIKNSR